MPCAIKPAKLNVDYQDIHSQHNQNKSNEIMIHPSKEMLQTSMPKLISEVAEALSMNKCYRQNIHEIFYNYKNAVNVSKDLYTKVAEMLAQFEKKHEYFYSNYFSTIVKESEKYKYITCIKACG